MSEHNLPDNNPNNEQPEQPNHNSESQLASAIVSPLRGFYWLERALSEIVAPHFSKWLAAGVLYAVLTLLIQFIDSRLAVILAFLNPVFIAGGILGAHKIAQATDAQTRISANQFFTGFLHPKKGQLLLFAVLQVALVLVISVLLVSLVDVESVQAINLEKLQDPQDPEQAAYFQQVLEIMSPLAPWLLLFFFFIIFVGWFAVSLILFSNENALTAITNSVIACVKNIFAFLVLFIIILIISLIILFALTIITPILSSISSMLSLLVLPLLLTAILWPIYVAVLYISFSEVFYLANSDS